MIEQPELALSTPPAVNQRPHGFAGLSAPQFAGAILLLAALIWAMWVTRALLAPAHERIVSVRLSQLVGEFVQAQARSAAPPRQVEADMQAFMAALDRTLQQRSAKGEVILVGEAVLSKTVPDVTDAVRQSVRTTARPATMAPALPAPIPNPADRDGRAR